MERNWRGVVLTGNTSLPEFGSYLPNDCHRCDTEQPTAACMLIKGEEAENTSHHCRQRVENQPVVTTITNPSTYTKWGKTVSDKKF